MIKLAIFDLDGTLVNSIYDLGDAVNYTLEKNGYPLHTTEEYKHFVGNGTRKLIERALPADTPAEEQERIFAEFSARYREHCLDKTLPYDGISELLAVLKERGIMCAYASNKPDEFAGEIILSIFGAGVFGVGSGKLDGVPAKPSPEIIASIIGRVGFKSDETVMIGDSDVDVKTAQNAGIRCIGCAWGFRGKNELLAAGADFIAEKPMDIARIITEEMT